MAISVNKVVLVGRLGADPTLRGGNVVTLSVATSEQWKDKQTGDRQEKTQWHTVVIFSEHTARFVAQYARKGDLVYVEGQLETRKWERGGDLEDKFFTEVIVKQFGGVVQLMSKDTGEARPKIDTRSSTEDLPAKGTSPLARGPSGGGHPLDDEIPFACEWR
jgi:single-strand DNA-binding protein